MKILLVDDDPVSHLINEKIISRTMNYPKLEIISFLKAKEALTYTLQHNRSNSQEDLYIFLDLNMPVFNGWDFLDGLEEFKVNKIFVFILTSSIYYKDRQKAEEYKSVKEFLVKPLCVSSINKIFDEIIPSYSIKY